MKANPEEIARRLSDARYHVQVKRNGDLNLNAARRCICCDKPSVHIDYAGDHYLAQVQLPSGRKTHVFYCAEGCEDPDVSRYPDGRHVVWRCPCDDAKTVADGWTPAKASKGDEYGYSTAYDTCGEVCFMCNRRRDDPERPRAGKYD